MKITLNQASIYIFASLLNTLILNQNPTPTMSQAKPNRTDPMYVYPNVFALLIEIFLQFK